ncbi:MAG: SDR family oxidoreductase [Calditrichaeota bacterium]|nr:SDR family oxidoreductase [Calditrichota bacterium]
MLVQELLKKDLFKGKTVFITGGGSGINYGIAENFAALGANISICGRKQERLDQARKSLLKLTGSVFAKSADVRDYDALKSVMDESESFHGPIHTLVCGAAGNFVAPIEGMSANGFKTVIDIDLNGSFNASKAAVDQLKKTKGNIIFISAGQAFIPYMAQSHVGAAKAGIDNLMKNIAMEWGAYGIRSNSIAPGPIAGTEGMKRLAPGEIGKRLKEYIPLQRMGETADIGQAAVFLASPLASYITGTCLVVDGGSNLPGSGLFTKVMLEALSGAE